MMILPVLQQIALDIHEGHWEGPLIEQLAHTTACLHTQQHVLI